MVSSTSPAADNQDAPALLDGALLDLLEGIPEPALIIRPGGRIVAVNLAGTRLSKHQAVDMSIWELLERYEARRAEGGPLIRGDLPCARTLRGEHVIHGEPFDGTFPGGPVYRALLMSSPVVVEEKVVAALSDRHDFEPDLRGLRNRGATGCEQHHRRAVTARYQRGLVDSLHRVDTPRTPPALVAGRVKKNAGSSGTRPRRHPILPPCLSTRLLAPTRPRPMSADSRSRTASLDMHGGSRPTLPGIKVMIRARIG